MAGSGYYASLSAEQVQQLFACEDEDTIYDEFLESLWEDYDDEGWDIVDLDKCWRATHFALTGGCFHETEDEIAKNEGWSFWLTGDIYARDWGESIVRKATLGGKMLTTLHDRFVFYITAEEVRELAVALEPFTQDWWEEFIKKESILQELLPTDDWSYIGNLLYNTVGFFRNAAEQGKAAVFHISI
jgi:hypothetical protein